MNAGSTIRKVLFISIWILIGGGMISLLLAAISTKNKGICKKYEINFRGAQKNVFINAKNVEALLIQAANGKIVGQPVKSINLHELENMLERNSWIDKAELYFDNGNVLHVKVSEKKPVARIITKDNQSFLIDSLGRTIPMSEQTTAKLPVFTSFPHTQPMSRADSLLLDEIRIVANYIHSQPLWMAQVSQIDITEDHRFEMIPEIGNHLVRLGNADNIDRKFNRLYAFYTQILSKTGFDRYKTIDVQYKGQVVASRSEGNPKVDSIQLRRNVERLLKLSQQAEKDTVIKAPPIIKLEADSAVAPDPSLQDEKPRVPKAVMPKREN